MKKIGLFGKGGCGGSKPLIPNTIALRARSPKIGPNPGLQPPRIDSATHNYLTTGTERTSASNGTADSPPRRTLVRFVPIADIANKQLAKCGSRQPTHSNHISAQLNRRHVKSF